MDFEVKKIEKQDLVNAAVKQFIHKISKDEWKNGDKLPPEGKLCELFGVGRYSMRVALDRLNTMGFIETRHGDGSYIKQMDPSVYLNSILPMSCFSENSYLIVTQLRVGIEIESAYLAALNASEKQVDAMRATLKMMDGYKDNPNLYIEYDNQFHIQVAEASDNPIFMHIMNIINLFYSAQLEQSVDISMFCQHEPILNAIAEHNPVEASRFMEEHMRNINQVAQKWYLQR